MYECEMAVKCIHALATAISYLCILNISQQNLLCLSAIIQTVITLLLWRMRPKTQQ